MGIAVHPLSPSQEPEAKALYTAIKNDNVDILRSLLEHDGISDFHFFHYCGETPISMALSENKQDLLPVLLNKTNKHFALHIAVKLKKEQVIRYLLSHCQFSSKFLHFLGL